MNESRENMLDLSNYDSNTLIVDDEGDGDYTSIQAAINNASSGDTVVVFSGSYKEKIKIDQDNIILESRDYELGMGDDSGPPIIQSDSEDYLVYLSGEQVTINGFSFQNSGYQSNGRGLILHSPYNTIINNQFNDICYSIILYTSDGNDISNNVIEQSEYAIVLYDSTDNDISNNNIESRKYGIFLEGSDENIMSMNTISKCLVGVFCNGSSKNSIQNNILEKNEKGCYLNNSALNEFSENTIKRNEEGISLYYSRTNKFFSNTVNENGKGFLLDFSSSSNNISFNMIAYNEFEGVSISGSSANILFKNNITNNKIGASFVFSTYNYVYYNKLKSNNDGMFFQYAQISDIQYNSMTGNSHSIVLDSSTEITISHNDINTYQFGESIIAYYSTNDVISNNDIFNAGISLHGCNNMAITSNYISNALDGIYVNFSDNNLIRSNMITLSNFHGIYLKSSSNSNYIYNNNLVKNNVNAQDFGSNIWDKGISLGGNYWDDYTGADANGDGIGDSPYIIPGGTNQDRYPLMFQWGAPIKPTTPDGPSKVKAGKNYTFSSLSIDPNDDRIQYGWDWDGDKRVDEWTMFYESGEKNTVSHAWTDEGTVSIYVKAIDEHGAESDWSDPLTIAVPKEKPILFPFLDFFLKISLSI